MNKKIVGIFLILFYRFLLDSIYLSEISPLFDYFLMEDNSNKTSLIVSWGLLLLFIPFIMWVFDPKEESAGSYATLLLFSLRVVPFTSFMRFSPQSIDYLFLNIVYWILFFLLLRYWKRVRVPKIEAKTEMPIYMITIIAVGTVLLVSGVYANFRIHLSLSDVYDLREEARAFGMPKILSYFNAATANIIPILMVYFIRTNNKRVVYFLAFIGLLNFSVAGSKSTLFKILLCFLLSFKKDLNLKKVMIPSLVVLAVTSLVEFYSLDTSFISTIVIRRMFYVPNMLDTLYYSYIHMHSPVFFDTDSYRTISFAIGAEYFGRDEMRANNGLFTDAYVNLGAIGCVIFPFILTYFIKMCESLFKNTDKGITLFAVFLIVTTLGSSMFTTSLLTHGLVLLIITVALIPSFNKVSYANKAKL